MYENGAKAAAVTGTSATVTGLAATTYSFTVTASNSAGGVRTLGCGARHHRVIRGGGGSPGSYVVAPYADMTNNQEPMLNQAATQAGLKAFSAAFVINAMAMDYYGSYDTGGAAVGTDAVDAAQATLAYAQTLWPGMTYASIGVTPMIGQNDDPAEVFTEADAQTLVSSRRSSSSTPADPPGLSSSQPAGHRLPNNKQ